MSATERAGREGADPGRWAEEKARALDEIGDVRALPPGSARSLRRLEDELDADLTLRARSATGPPGRSADRRRSRRLGVARIKLCTSKPFARSVCRQVDGRRRPRQAGASVEVVEDMRRRLLIEQIDARSARDGASVDCIIGNSCETSRSVRVSTGVRPMSPRP